jgi:hypothetical protein
MARCSCISCSGKWPFEVAAANLSGASDHSTSRHHSQIVSWTFATCARGVARRRSAPLKKKRRRASGRLIAEARGSLACTANSERRYATGNHRIGDRTQVRAFALVRGTVSHIVAGLLMRGSTMMCACC